MTTAPHRNACPRPHLHQFPRGLFAQVQIILALVIGMDERVHSAPALHGIIKVHALHAGVGDRLAHVLVTMDQESKEDGIGGR